MSKITMDIQDLESLLNQQKRIVIERLLGSTSAYNPESNDGHSKSMNIKKEVFEELGMTARYPQEFQTLKKYLP